VFGKNVAISNILFFSGSLLLSKSGPREKQTIIGGIAITSRLGIVERVAAVVSSPLARGRCRNIGG
jgi:hypothetical protein